MNARDHWLTRPRTLRVLQVVFVAMLALTVAAQWWAPVHGHFGADGAFGFHAVYGLTTCVAMVWAAKLLGLWLKRRDDYYDDD